MSFQVDSDYFRGPIDLLLYLVRRHEVEVTSIALAKVTHRYLEYLDILKEISINAVGDFVEVCLLYTSPSPRDQRGSRMPSTA